MSNSSLKLLPALLVAIGLFMAAFARSANADLIDYFNFEDATTGNAPDFGSEADQGLGISNTITTTYSTMITVAQTDPSNRLAADTDSPPNGLVGLGLARSATNNNVPFVIPLFSASGIYSNLSLSFLINNVGGGFTSANILYSTNGGASFVPAFGFPLMSAGGLQTVSGSIPTAANNAPQLELEIQFAGGQSNGITTQDIIDNIQVNGTVGASGVPDTGTTASLFGLSLAGLAFFRRKLA